MNSFKLLQKWDSLKVAFLPIKPVYAERIMNGTKRFEFRRRPFSADVTQVLVYASSLYKRVLGVVEVEPIESGLAQ